MRKKPKDEAAEPKKSVLQELDHWFFGRHHPATLGLFRILIASMAFLSLLFTFFDFDAWYTERGFVPSQNAIRWVGEDFPRLNLLLLSNSTPYTLVFYVVTMMAAVLTAVGLYTRISSIVLAIGLVSIHHRNPIILHSGDTLLRLCILYIAVAPSGAACSLDRFIGVWKGKLPAEPKPISVWAQRIVQIQIALIYFTTVWWKMFGTYWKDGTATWYPTQLHEFDRFPVPGFMERQPFLGVTTYGTLAVEFALATLVFYRPFRKWILVLGLGMHLYIEYRFNIPMFAAIITSGYVCFYEGEEIVAWAKKQGQKMRRLKLRVFLPAGHEFVPERGAAVKNMDPLDLVAYEQGTESEWRAETAGGKKDPPFVASWLRSLGAWPLLFAWRRILRRSIHPVGVAKGQEEAREASGAATA